jgi:hypothetical protein
LAHGPSREFWKTRFNQIKRLSDDEGAIELERMGQPARWRPKPAKRRRKPVPSAITKGIKLINKLRAAAVTSPDAEALQELDASCSRALLDWWSDDRNRLAVCRAPVASPVETLSSGEAAVIGALCEWVMQARYPENAHDEPAMLLLDSARRGLLDDLGITDDLAKMVLLFEKKPHWRALIRRCLYMFAPGSDDLCGVQIYGKLTRGCLAYFVDKAPAANTIGCTRSHSVRVLEYRNTTGEGKYKRSLPQRGIRRRKP